MLLASWLPKFLARREKRKVKRDADYLHNVADEIIAKRREEAWAGTTICSTSCWPPTSTRPTSAIN